MASIFNRRIGTLRLDVTTSEEHESNLRISDNPIESGSVISDHAVVEPKQITIEGMVISYEPPSFNTNDNQPPTVRPPDFINQVGFGDLALFTPVTLLKMASLPSVVVNNIRPIGKYTPTGIDTSGFGNGINARIAKIQADFEALQASGETIEINTGVKLYKNMLIAMIGTTQTIDGNVLIRITAREVIIVETSSTGVLGGIKKAGRTAIQSAGKTTRGDVNTQEAPPKKKKSLMREGTGFSL